MPGWPDLVIGGIVGYFGWKGFRNGFVAELAGPVAVSIAAFAAFVYPGSLDADVANLTHLGPGSAHALGTVAFAAIVYIIVALIAWLLGRLAAFPGIAIVNQTAGAAVGALKALFVAWAVLYVALFFPLTRDLRADLHASPLIRGLEAPNRAVDALVDQYVPVILRPIVMPFWMQHRT